ncbi:hypothetical protein GCM10009759_07320 [Kitasatospora saccharophila]|uniref:Uncharacterized protein n=1 Tax=Kitasatospora saccharophila TaxID=407973 RepID=A0ABN2W8I5_9ACTN
MAARAAGAAASGGTVVARADRTAVVRNARRLMRLSEGEGGSWPGRGRWGHAHRRWGGARGAAVGRTAPGGDFECASFYNWRKSRRADSGGQPVERSEKP